MNSKNNVIGKNNKGLKEIIKIIIKNSYMSRGQNNQ